MYRYLALKGGGAKGFAYVGVAAQLEQFNLLRSLDTIAGISVGGIAALIFATGWDADKISTTIFDLDLKQLLFGAHDFQQGSHPALKLYQWFKDVVESITENPECTFAQWHHIKERYPQENLKDICIEAHNLRTGQNEVFSFFSQHQDVSIADAIRATMAFPGFFSPWEINGQLYCDGGIAKECPLDLFEDSKGILNPLALGIWLGPPLQSTPHHDKFIYCDTLGIDTLQFDLSLEQKQALSDAGANAVKNYMAQHHPALLKHLRAKRA